MVTREQIEAALDDESKTPYKKRDIDHKVTAINLLRERIPYEACKCIIEAAEHDVIYLCNLDLVEEYLSEEDLEVLADCNCWIEEDNECLALFV